MSNSSKNISRVLIVTDKGHIGGAQNWIDQIARGLVRGGVKVYLVEGASKKQFQKTKTRTKEGIHCFYYPVSEGNFYCTALATILQTKKLIAKLIAKIDFDLIYSHLPTSSFALYLVRKTAGIPRITHFHGARFQETKATISRPRHRILGSIKRFINFYPIIFIERFLQTYPLKRADWIITYSQFAKKEITKNFPVKPSKISIIPGGVDVKRFKPSKKRAVLRKGLKITPERPFLFIASRLVPRKGIENAIKALPLILKESPRTLLMIAFPLDKDGVFYYPRLLQLQKELKLENSLKFITNPSQKKLVSLYQAADCFLMVSTCLETFGMTTIEALACGTPVLGTPVCATPEILKPLDKRLLFKGVKPEEIAQGVIKFLSLPKKEKDSLRKKSAIYVKKFSWEKQTEKLIKVFQNLKKGSQRESGLFD